MPTVTCGLCYFECRYLSLNTKTIQINQTVLQGMYYKECYILLGSRGAMIFGKNLISHLNTFYWYNLPTDLCPNLFLNIYIFW